MLCVLLSLLVDVGFCGGGGGSGGEESKGDPQPQKKVLTDDEINNLFVKSGGMGLSKEDFKKAIREGRLTFSQQSSTKTQVVERQVAIKQQAPKVTEQMEVNVEEGSSDLDLTLAYIRKVVPEFKINQDFAEFIQDLDGEDEVRMASQFGKFYHFYEDFLKATEDLLSTGKLPQTWQPQTQKTALALREFLLSNFYDRIDKKAAYIYTKKSFEKAKAAIQEFERAFHDACYDEEKCPLECQTYHILLDLNKELNLPIQGQYYYDEITQVLPQEKCEFLFKMVGQFTEHPIISFFDQFAFYHFYLGFLKFMIDFSLDKGGASLNKLLFPLHEQLVMAVDKADVELFNTESGKLAQIFIPLDVYMATVSKFNGAAATIASPANPWTSPIRPKSAALLAAIKAELMKAQSIENKAQARLVLDVKRTSISYGTVKRHETFSDRSLVLKSKTELAKAQIAIPDEKAFGIRVEFMSEVFEYTPLENEIMEIFDYFEQIFAIAQEQKVMFWAILFNAQLSCFADLIQVMESGKDVTVSYPKPMINVIKAHIVDFDKISTGVTGELANILKNFREVLTRFDQKLSSTDLKLFNYDDNNELAQQYESFRPLREEFVKVLQGKSTIVLGGFKFKNQKRTTTTHSHSSSKQTITTQTQSSSRQTSTSVKFTQEEIKEFTAYMTAHYGGLKTPMWDHNKGYFVDSQNPSMRLDFPEKFQIKYKEALGLIDKVSETDLKNKISGEIARQIGSNQGSLRENAVEKVIESEDDYDFDAVNNVFKNKQGATVQVSNDIRIKYANKHPQYRSLITTGKYETKMMGTKSYQELRSSYGDDWMKVADMTYDPVRKGFYNSQNIQVNLSAQTLNKFLELNPAVGGQMPNVQKSATKTEKFSVQTQSGTLEADTFEGLQAIAAQKGIVVLKITWDAKKNKFVDQDGKEAELEEEEKAQLAQLKQGGYVLLYYTQEEVKVASGEKVTERVHTTSSEQRVQKVESSSSSQKNVQNNQVLSGGQRIQTFQSSSGGGQKSESFQSSSGGGNFKTENFQFTLGGGGQKSSEQSGKSREDLFNTLREKDGKYFLGENEISQQMFNQIKMARGKFDLFGGQGPKFELGGFQSYEKQYYEVNGQSTEKEVYKNAKKAMFKYKVNNMEVSLEEYLLAKERLGKTVYFVDNVEVDEATYLKAKAEGTRYFVDGKLVSKKEYEEAQAMQGTMIYTVNGQKVSREEYEEALKKQGKMVYYINGKVVSEDEYNNALQSDDYTTFHLNGKKVSKAEMLMAMSDMSKFKYFVNGEEVSYENYKKGIEKQGKQVYYIGDREVNEDEYVEAIKLKSVDTYILNGKSVSKQDYDAAVQAASNGHYVVNGKVVGKATFEAALKKMGASAKTYMNEGNANLFTDVTTKHTYMVNGKVVDKAAYDAARNNFKVEIKANTEEIII